MLRVGTQCLVRSADIRDARYASPAQLWPIDAERLRLRSHAEHGNKGLGQIAPRLPPAATKPFSVGPLFLGCSRAKNRETRDFNQLRSGL
jgi:hypothetical protein